MCLCACFAVCAVSILTSPELGYNPYTLSRITHILSIILSTAPLTDELQPSIIVFVQHLIAKINALSSSSPSISSNLINRDLMSCLIALKALLYRETIQQYFFQNEGFKSLCHLLNKDIQNAQLLYIVGFNIWLLSYTKAYCVSLQELGIIRKLVSIVKVNVMEKVIRICFSILRNFLEHQIDSFNEEMIGKPISPLLVHSSCPFCSLSALAMVCTFRAWIGSSSGNTIETKVQRS